MIAQWEKKISNIGHRRLYFPQTASIIFPILPTLLCVTLSPPSRSAHFSTVFGLIVSYDCLAEECCQSLLQGIFWTQESNPGHQHCRWILYHLSHWGRLVSTMVMSHRVILLPHNPLSSWVSVSCPQEAWAWQPLPQAGDPQGSLAVNRNPLNFYLCSWQLPQPCPV